MNSHRLQHLDPEAWTYLLRRDSQMMDVVVVEVTAEPISSSVTRYLLTLSHAPEPISLIGKETNISEVRFYRYFAQQLNWLVPRCWFSEIREREGWIVLDEVTGYHTAETWQQADIEGMVTDLATLHSTFWEIDLDQPEVLPLFLGRGTHPRPSWGQRPNYSQFHMARNGHKSEPSALWYNQVGTQTAALMKALAGLQVLRALGGWPGVLTEQQLDAAAELLEAPHQMLGPLRALPHTLLSGRAEVDNWHMGMFSERTLLDWRHVAIGPGVCDLVGFVEHYYAYRAMAAPDDATLTEQWPLLEETLFDSYFIQLSRELEARDPGHRYSSRDVRRNALPAARCLFILTYWLPRFSDWFMDLPNTPHPWLRIAEMDDAQLAAVGYIPLIGLRPHIAAVFERFLNAYKLLSSS